MADFDWVAARAECSLGVLFEKIRLEAERNVATINKLGERDGAKRRFEISPHGERFGVICDEGKDKANSVVFELGRSTIRISGFVKTPFEAVPSLNQQGICRLLVNDKELEIWQVCRAALYDLFFG